MSHISANQSDSNQSNSKQGHSNSSHLKQTPLYHEHIALNARMVDFGGWDLPVSYVSQVEEHHAVRNNAGMFDVSHMRVTDIKGEGTLAFLSYLLANDIHKVSKQTGKALYSCMLNESGGVIDDLIVYYLDEQYCRLVTNAATYEKDMSWIHQQSQSFSVSIEEKPDLALIAVQGPNAIEISSSIVDENSKAFIQSLSRFQGGFSEALFVGRTGYTGEDGLEFILPSAMAVALWKKLVKAGVQPCGLGARDTLRLEAGMALYGSDLDESHTPIESGLKWTVAMKDDRNFIGRSALEKRPNHQMVGLVLEDKGVLRSHQDVYLNNELIGQTTSGGFSPTLNQSIALARVSSEKPLEEGSKLTIQIRNRQLTSRVVKYPFL